MRTPRVYRASGLLLLVVGLFLYPVTALAQTGAASVTGIVTDQSGATVPGATVTATNQATNVVYTALSNEAGNYTITSLPVGTYVVKAELASFKTAATKPIQAEAMQVVRIDFKLELGSLEQTVEVTGETPVLTSVVISPASPSVAVGASAAGFADAVLEPPLGAAAWRGWRFLWDAGEGEHVLCSRATDAAGNTQPLEPPWNLKGYANNAVERVPVTVAGPS